VRILLAIALAAALLGGCAAEKRTGKPIEGVTAAAIVEAHNARVSMLDRLWARTSVQVTSTNNRGDRLREQGEGHLQIVQPSSIALTLGKMGKTKLYLGSNERVYWWLDLIDADEKVALIGRHDLVTLEKAAMLGVPVYPRDLVHLLGITPLPADRASAGLEWDSQSRAGVRAPTDSGWRRVWFDPFTFEPRRVEMFDSRGNLVLESELDRYDYVTVVGDAHSKPRIAERADITIPADQTAIKLSLYAPENRAIRPTAFDIDRLIKGYRIDLVYDLDAPDTLSTIEP